MHLYNDRLSLLFSLSIIEKYSDFIWIEFETYLITVNVKYSDIIVDIVIYWYILVGLYG